MRISDWSSDVCSSDLGAGYIEESILPRLYRQAPLNSFWGGSGNIQCLDVLRALAREPESGAALLDALEVAAGMAAGHDAWLSGRKTDLASGRIEGASRRSLVQRPAVALTVRVFLRP